MHRQTATHQVASPYAAAYGFQMTTGQRQPQSMAGRRTFPNPGGPEKGPEDGLKLLDRNTRPIVLYRELVSTTFLLQPLPSCDDLLKVALCVGLGEAHCGAARAV